MVPDETSIPLASGVLVVFAGGVAVPEIIVAHPIATVSPTITMVGPAQRFASLIISFLQFQS
jgi:hypothetical protein